MKRSGQNDADGGKPTNPRILTINGGSSSIKFALFEAGDRGFDNCLLSDMLGNVAELANSNVFMVKDGVVMTPAPNGTFLDGITRQRTIQLLRGAGETVVETSLRYADFEQADEIFSSGNFAKLSAITRIDDRELQPGPIFRKASELYRAFASENVL